MNTSELLNDIYYIKKNYDGINQLYLKAKAINPKIKKSEVKEWLDKQNSHQQTKSKVGTKTFLPIYSETPYSFQIDLTFFPRYVNQNKGFHVLFTAININTRYAYAYFSKSKDMRTITGFLKQMEEKTPINTVTCDKGKEFANREFIDFCNEKNIAIFLVKGDSHKLGIVNRFHRTIKNKLTKHFISTNSVNWIDAIDDIINNYNNSVNRGIGVAPIKVNNAIETDIITEMRKETDRLKSVLPEIFESGDAVRIFRNKKLFGDKQLSKYGDEVYKVVKVYKNALDIKGEDGKTQRVKQSEVLKVKQAGVYTPPISAIIAANKEHSSSAKLRREGLDIANIIKANEEPQPLKYVRTPKGLNFFKTK